MPTYDYQCTQCQQRFEAYRPMSASNPECLACGGLTVKMFLFAPAMHGNMACGREQAMRSFEQNSDSINRMHGPGCRCRQH
ncbi:MAG: zinc ribbon domain-containing protein [Nitrosomonas sp.]|nr:MAG: zinc ribbon domain-containing protein [Nitrosomonas sp.]